MAKDPFIPFECYCGSLGCYNCRTQAQVNVSAEFFRVFRGYAEPALLSIVPTDAQYTSDELAEFDLNAFVLKHRRKSLLAFLWTALRLGVWIFASMSLKTAKVDGRCTCT